MFLSDPVREELHQKCRHFFCLTSVPWDFACNAGAAENPLQHRELNGFNGMTRTNAI
jgi:hypothetical protein